MISTRSSPICARCRRRSDCGGPAAHAEFASPANLGGDMSGWAGRSRGAAWFSGALCAAALLAPSIAQAEYPDRPIRLIIPFAAGGATDILGRSVADFLGKEFKQSIIVENKPGANTSVAADFVAHAP